MATRWLILKTNRIKKNVNNVETKGRDPASQHKNKTTDYV